MPYKLLFLTERSLHHQQWAIQSAPPSLAITFLSHTARAEILQHLVDSDFLITERAGLIDAQLIASAPKLRLIQRLGSLTYDIDVASTQKAGIPVCATPVQGCILVAEHLLLQMLALSKKLHEVSAIANAAGNWRTPRRTDENTFAYNWSKRRGVGGIYGSTIGILGFGEIGAELARRLKGMQPARLLYHKRQPLLAEVEAELGITYAQPDQIYHESDFLCCLLPYSKETDNLLNAAVFAQMKPSALLVHCGSGSVIDESALASALRTGQIAGAALDTYEWEPIKPDNPLVPLARMSSMNLLLTPHIAFGTGDRKTKEEWSDFENIMRLLDGVALMDRVA